MAIKGMSTKEFGKTLLQEYKRDNVQDSGAALTYYAVLALFPFLLCLVALAGLVMDPAQVQQLAGELGSVAPQEAVGLIQDRLQALIAGPSGGIFTIGLLGALWAASGGMAALIRALNIAYDVEESRPFWKVRLLAIGMTIFAAAIAVVAALIAVASPAVGTALGPPFDTLITWLRLPVAGVLMMVVWALLYWALPDVEHRRFRLITPGALVAVLIWIAASWAFSFYVKNFGSYEATYGAIGGVIVLLLWMWISAQVVLLGAEINSIIERRSGALKRGGATLPPEGEEEGEGPAAHRPGRPTRPEHPGEPRQLH